MTLSKCSTTHYTGCACHEARRDALIAQLTAERDALYQALYQLTANAEFVLSRYRIGTLFAEPVEADEPAEDWRCAGCGQREWAEHDGVRLCRSCGARGYRERL